MGEGYTKLYYHTGRFHPALKWNELNDQAIQRHGTVTQGQKPVHEESTV